MKFSVEFTTQSLSVTLQKALFPKTDIPAEHRNTRDESRKKQARNKKFSGDSKFRKQQR